MYKLYKYCDGHWELKKELNSKEDLIALLAKFTKKTNNNHLVNYIIDHQNVTKKDTEIHCFSHQRCDATGKPVFIYSKVIGGYFPWYISSFEYRTRPWHVEDEHGKSIDLRTMRNEVIEAYNAFNPGEKWYYGVISDEDRLRNKRAASSYDYDRHLERNKTVYRNGTNNHIFSRTTKTFDEPNDDLSEILTTKQMQAMKVKPKDKFAKFYWYGDYSHVNNNGWKDGSMAKTQWGTKKKRNGKIWIDKNRNVLVEVEEMIDLEDDNED